MRTVHETEALRPSDPVPKSMQVSGGAAGKSASKLKIIIKTPQSHAAGQDDAVEDGHVADDMADLFTPLIEEQGFTKEELAMPLDRLHGLCRWQVRWAEADGEELKKQCRAWEEAHKQAWLEKQVLLDQMVQSEADWHVRRKAVLSGIADVQIAPEVVINGPEGSPVANWALAENGAAD